MRFVVPIVIICCSAGCTSDALKRATLAHAFSSTDYSYREVMENLAMIANNPSALPAYSTVYAGTTDVNDIVNATSKSAWTRTALEHPARLVTFFAQTADFMGSRAVKSNWTLDPTVVPEKLRAMRAACQWVTLGPDHVGLDRGYLERYEEPEYKITGHGISIQIRKKIDPRSVPALASSVLIYTLLNRDSSGRESESDARIRIVGKDRRIIVDELSEFIDPKIRRVAADGTVDANPPIPEAIPAQLSRESLQGYAEYIRSLDPNDLIYEIASIIDAANRKYSIHDKQSISLSALMNEWRVDNVKLREGSPDGYYFDVADSLARIGSGWVHIETRQCEVPKDAAFVAKCEDTFVWVGAKDLGSLTEFSLILQSIARADFNSVFYPRPLTRTVQKEFNFRLSNEEYHGSATFNVDRNGFITAGPGQPSLPPKARIDNVGLNADLKSVINAAAKSPAS